MENPFAGRTWEKKRGGIGKKEGCPLVSKRKEG